MRELLVCLYTISSAEKTMTLELRSTHERHTQRPAYYCSIHCVSVMLFSRSSPALCSTVNLLLHQRCPCLRQKDDAPIPRVVPINSRSPFLPKTCSLVRLLVGLPDRPNPICALLLSCVVRFVFSRSGRGPSVLDRQLMLLSSTSLILVMAKSVRCSREDVYKLFHASLTACT